MTTLTPNRTQLRSRRAFRFTNGARFEVRLPDDWRSLIDGSNDLSPGTELSFGPVGDQQRLLATVVHGDPGGPVLEMPDLRRFVDVSVAQFQSQLADTHVEIRRIDTLNASGYVYTLKDSNPAPGEFLYMTQASVIIGPDRILFTLLTNEGEDAVALAGLSIISTSKLIGISSATLTQPVEEPTSMFEEFERIELANEACLYVQDYPELLAGDFVGKRMRSQAIDTVSARTLVACVCLQRIAAHGPSLAIGPAEFENMGHELRRLIAILVSMPSPEQTKTRMSVLTRLNALDELTGSDLRLVTYLRVSLVEDLVVEGAAGRPALMRLVIATLEECLTRLGSPSDRYLHARACSFLGYLLSNDAAPPSAEKIDAAIEMGDQALLDYNLSGLRSDWATLQIRQGINFVRRVYGVRADNLNEAIGRYKLALSICGADPDIARGANTNIGLVYLELANNTDAAKIKLAIDHLQEALRLSLQEGSDWRTSRARLNLGNAYLAMSTSDIEAQEIAIDLYRKAEPFLSRHLDPVNWAGIQHNLGKAFSSREIGNASENSLEAIGRFQAALQIRTLEALPREHLASSQELAAVYMKMADFQAAVEALQSAIAADRTIAGGLRLRTEIRAQYARSQRLYPEVAYCLLKQGRFKEALAAAETGRARELQQILAVGEDDPSRETFLGDVTTALLDTVLTDATSLTKDSLETKSLRRSFGHQKQRLLEALSDRDKTKPFARPEWPVPEPDVLLAAVASTDVVVIPILSVVGAASLIIRSGSSDISADDIVWHADFSIERAKMLLLGSKKLGLARGWLIAYFNNKSEVDAWRSTITRIGGLMWTGLVGEIQKSLEARDLGADTRLVIVPPPELSVLPWHSSWRDTDAGRRYLVDDHVVKCAPSLSIYASLQRRRAERPSQPTGRVSSLVVADTELNLDFAAIEGMVIAQLADTNQDDLLIGEASSFIAVSSRSKNKDLLHFACHGVYNLSDPMWSYLSLGRSGVSLPGSTGNLRLRELVSSWRDIRAKLVTLSACETALPELTGLPSESLSLATGWLSAGALAVISSHWIVDDFCTLVLMRAFYYEYLVDGADDAPAALRTAQLSLKSASSVELAERVAVLEILPGLSAKQVVLLQEKRHEFESLPEVARPYSEPYWWAGFGYSGV